MGVLAEEWESEPGARDRAPVPARWRIALAAAIVATSRPASGWPSSAAPATSRRTRRASGPSLGTLGGTGFKVGSLEPASREQPVEGSVVAYESSHDQSFVVVFVRTPELTGIGSLEVSRADGVLGPRPDPVRR